MVDGKRTPVIAPNASGLGSTPIGPTLRGHYFLGADTQGRDVAARLLYAGRISLTAGFGAAILTAVLATIIGLIAGMAGGIVDAIISRLLELLWAFPVYLLAVCLSTVLLLQGIKLGPVTVSPNSIWLPITIIGVVYIPYLARPVRGEVMAAKEREFMQAAVAQGASWLRLVFGELLAQRPAAGDRLLPAPDRHRHPHRVGPLLPVDRGAAAAGQPRARWSPTARASSTPGRGCRSLPGC